MNKILKKCISRGFLLNKEVLEILSELDEKKICDIIDILTKTNKKIITKEIFNKNIDNFKNLLINKNKKENLGTKNVKILSKSDFNSEKIKINDFVCHFRARYKILAKILENKNFMNLSSIRRIGFNNEVCSIIVAILNKKITKNKNLLIEVEDLTGSSVILVNRDNIELFEKAKGLMLDDIVAFKVSGSNKILFANDIIYPDIALEKERFCDVDEYVAFSGDFHIGSKMFLEKNLLRFVEWLNGEIGDSRQQAIAKKVKYLFLVGDNIDGVGVYSGQEKFLDIKSCRGQYRKVGEILGKIREDIQIIMCPGQHDAVWVGEPQSAISEKWAPSLYKMKNLHLVPNPALIEIGEGFKILMYHGASINRFIDKIDNIRVNFGHSSPTKVVKEILKRRHFAPTHGVMDYVPNKEKDFMVIDVVPDIIVTADQHRAEVDSYNNILMIASSCWQSRTPFEEKVGNIPEPCRVPLFNLKTREVKIIDFSDDDIIKWDSSEDLVCELEGKNGK